MDRETEVCNPGDWSLCDSAIACAIAEPAFVSLCDRESCEEDDGEEDSGARSERCAMHAPFPSIHSITLQAKVYPNPDSPWLVYTLHSLRSAGCGVSHDREFERSHTSNYCFKNGGHDSGGGQPNIQVASRMASTERGSRRRMNAWAHL
ncbi:hypothetical protein DM860_001076 [Cuscuta australis]|uniref:Uncharacterized protein n=1 Tax=Cuscuta australis TaxID=267555 RepID=A0A328DTT5_9ASTE|nr:hypothetical protein DM860_001076 [Cuscuta australis]